jgi:hypothetical protein
MFLNFASRTGGFSIGYFDEKFWVYNKFTILIEKYEVLAFFVRIVRNRQP